MCFLVDEGQQLRAHLDTFRLLDAKAFLQLFHSLLRFEQFFLAARYGTARAGERDDGGGGGIGRR